MSNHDPVNHILGAREKVNFIVPERIREACSVRGYTYSEAAERCNIPIRTFGLMANGHKEIPKEYIFGLMRGLNFPKDFFFYVQWERT